jgi:lipoate-protein ligase A
MDNKIYMQFLYRLLNGIENEIYIEENNLFYEKFHKISRIEFLNSIIKYSKKTRKLLRSDKMQELIKQIEEEYKGLERKLKLSKEAILKLQDKYANAKYGSNKWFEILSFCQKHGDELGLNVGKDITEKIIEILREKINDKK